MTDNMNMQDSSFETKPEKNVKHNIVIASSLKKTVFLISRLNIIRFFFNINIDKQSSLIRLVILYVIRTFFSLKQYLKVIMYLSVKSKLSFTLEFFVNWRFLLCYFFYINRFIVI